MARYLALDWDHQQLRIVAASVRAGQLHIEHAAVWQEEHSPNPGEAAALGQRLRERLRSAGIAAAPVLACVGRDRVILREIRYPAVAAAEEPEVVRFQVLKELTDAAHEVVIDYTPLGEVAPGEERRALVLTLRRELLQAYQTQCRSAGLKLHALTPRPFGTLACLAACTNHRPAGAPKDGSAQPALALVTSSERWSEFCLVRGDTLLVARSLPAGPGLAAEIRRNIAVYSAQSPRHVVSALYLAGNGENTALQECLARSLDMPVRSFDPFAGTAGAVATESQRGAFAGAVGLLRAQAAERPLAINFACPKQAEVSRDPKKRRLVLAAGLAALFLLGLVSYCYSELAALDRVISAKQAERIGLDGQLLKIETEEKDLKELADWSRGNISWLDELYNLTALVGDLRTLQISEIDGVVQPGAKPDKPVAKMDLKILATHDDAPVKGLLDDMAKDEHYVSGARHQLKDTVKEAPFTRLFGASIEVDKQPAEKYSHHLPEPSSGQTAKVMPRKAPLPAYRPTSIGNGVPDSRIAKPHTSGKVKYVTPPPGFDNVPKNTGPPTTQPQPGAAAPSSPVYEKIKEAFWAPPPPVGPGLSTAETERIRRERLQKMRESRPVAPPPSAPTKDAKKQ